MKTKSKAFLDLILLHAKNPKRTKERLQTDRRLNQDERNIVRGFLLMRDNLNEKAHSLAQSIRCQQDPFVEAMRIYLMGATLNNQGKYTKALHYFKDCHHLLPKGFNPHLEFVILNNIFIIHMNLHQLAESREFLMMMQMISPIPEEDTLTLQRLKFGFYLASEDSKNADESYALLSQNRGSFKDHELNALLIQFFRYGIVFNQLDICDGALNELKDQKKYALTQNFNYMKILLNHLRDHAPVYIQEQDFKDYPTLLLELKLIRALDQAKISELPQLWKDLQRINPQSFLDGYQYAGYRSVFSRCLELHQEKLKGFKTLSVKEPTMSILDAIKYKLENEDFVSKEQLHYYLYGKELESKLDLNRVSKYVNKLKTTGDLEIESVRGGYRLNKKSA